MRPVLMRFMRAIGQSMRWLNDPVNEKEAVRIMMDRLKIDETIAARTFKFMVPENHAFRGESMVDPVGLNEMIRLLAMDNLIPERKPWETFVDAGFLPARRNDLAGNSSAADSNVLNGLNYLNVLNEFSLRWSAPRESHNPNI